MSVLTGTWQLTKLNLRRDRLTLPLWVIGIAILLTTAVPSLEASLGTSQTQLTKYAGSVSHSIASRFLSGPIGGAETGAMLMNEYFNFTAVIVIFVSTMAIVRHTRQNEETGRSEIVGSGVIGRYAQLTAALAVVVGMNLLLGLLIFVGLTMNSQLPSLEVLALGAAFAGVGIVFAAIASVAVQIFESARASNAAVGAIVGLAVILRGTGDALGEVGADGVSVDSAWPSWLSPIGWGQQLRPFVDTNWWVLGLFGAAFVILTGLAYFLTSHRDHGSGMLPTRLGRSRAKKSLLSQLGLAWHLQHNIVLGWSTAIILIGVTYGLIANEFKDFILGNDSLQAILGSHPSESYQFIFFSATMMQAAFLVAAFAVQSALVMHAEENRGRLELLLSTAASRVGWMLSHIFISILGAVWLAVLAGLATAMTYGLVATDGWQYLDNLLAAGLIKVPAAIVFIGFVVFLFGILPRWSQILSWPIYTFSVLAALLGAALNLPDWALKTSVFWHTPAAPANDIDLQPLWVLLAVGAVLLVTGVIAFCRRGITND